MRDPRTPKHYQLIKWWILVYGGMFTFIPAMTASALAATAWLSVLWMALWLLVWGPPLLYQLFAFRRTLLLERRAEWLANAEKHLYDEWWEADDGSQVHRNFLVNGQVVLQNASRWYYRDMGISLIDAEWKEYCRRQTAERMLNDAAEFHERHPAATWEPPVGWNDASTAAEISRQLGAAWGEVLAARHAKRDALAAMGHSLPVIDERVRLAEERMRALEAKAGNEPPLTDDDERIGRR